MDRREILKSIGLVGGAGIFGYGFYLLTDEPDDGAGPAGPGLPTDRTDTTTRVETTLPTETKTRTETEEGPTTSTESTETRKTTESPTEETTESTTEKTTERTTKARDIPHAESFDTVVSAAANGVDSSGKTTVNALFKEHAADGTLLAFEPGTYKIDYFDLSNLDQFGIVGYGDGQVRFVPAGGDCRGGHPWVFFNNIRDLLLDNVAFDFRNASSGGPLHLFLRGDSTIRNVSYFGSCSNQLSAIRVDVRDQQGTAHFKNVVANNTDRNNSLTGIYVGDNHAGKLTFEDCNLENFSDNGLYASAPGGDGGKNGVVHVLRGNYHNNNVANLRLGSSNSRANGVRIIVDEEMPGWGQLNARGIRLRNAAGQVIENCEIVFEKQAADSFGAIVFHPKNGAGLVRDTKIRIERGGIPAIRVFPHESGGDSAPTFKGVVIDGQADSGVTATIEGRDGTTFENVRINQTGSDRRGLQFTDCSNCRVVNSEIEVANAPIAVTNGTVDVVNSTIHTPNGESRHVKDRKIKNETFQPW